MASERCRLVRSSSQGDAGMYTHIKPLIPPEPKWWEQKRPQAQNPPKNSTQALATPVSKRPQKLNVKELVQQQQQPPAPHPCQSIFALSSPTTGKTPADEGSMAFLKCCSLCKKQLRQDKDVYMYGYLTAFCSAKCRDHRMALDGLDIKMKADEAKKKKKAFEGKSDAAIR